MTGFLGSGATLSADLALLAELAMGGTLLFGAFLARRKRYAAHGLCQTAVVLLNLVVIAAAMWPSFRHQVAPRLPRHLHNRYHAVAAAHALLGGAAELLGLYTLLAAGTTLLPQRLRFRRWKLWMRVDLALWWLAVLTGIGTYYVWYMSVPPH